MAGLDGVLGGLSGDLGGQLKKDVVQLGSALQPQGGAADGGGADGLVSEFKSLEQQAGAAFKSAEGEVGSGFKAADASADAGAAQVQAAAHKTEAAAAKDSTKQTAAVDTYISWSDSISKSLAGESKKIQGILIKSFDAMIKKMVAGNMNLGDSLKGLAKSVGSSMIGAIASGLMAHGIEKTTEGAAQSAKSLPGGDALMAEGAAMMGAAAAMKSLSKTYLASGGLVSRPTLALIGEGGQSEAVVPLDKLKGGQVLAKGKQLSELTMTFHGIKSLADVTSGKLRKQATAHFKAALAGK
jgi:hypothetical protein